MDRGRQPPVNGLLTSDGIEARAPTAPTASLRTRNSRCRGDRPRRRPRNTRRCRLWWLTATESGNFEDYMAPWSDRPRKQWRRPCRLVAADLRVGARGLDPRAFAPKAPGHRREAAPACVAPFFSSRTTRSLKGARVGDEETQIRSGLDARSGRHARGAAKWLARDRGRQERWRARDPSGPSAYLCSGKKMRSWPTPPAHSSMV